jgi:hypothetical protein
MMRPTTSGVPPAAKGTITRTGLLGYCASAGVPAQSIHKPAKTTPRHLASQGMGPSLWPGFNLA